MGTLPILKEELPAGFGRRITSDVGYGKRRTSAVDGAEDIITSDVEKAPGGGESMYFELKKVPTALAKNS